MNTSKAEAKSQYRAYLSAELNGATVILEDNCMQLQRLNLDIGDDPEKAYFLQRFRNIVTKISLALSEVSGPRHFHQHYRHDESDGEVLLPVLEDPIELLAHSCEFALKESAKKLSGAHDKDLIAAQRMLEKSLNDFLDVYRENA